MKTCSKCGEEKPLLDFYIRRGKPRAACKVCTLASNKKGLSKEASKRAKDSYRERHREKLRQKHSVYKKENRGLCNASWAKYRASKLQATPSWLSEKDQKQIKRIYTTCSNVSERTGKPHHVDHIVPLQGENVCGLHVPWNLAIIPASMNLSKSNKF